MVMHNSTLWFYHYLQPVSCMQDTEKWRINWLCVRTTLYVYTLQWKGYVHTYVYVTQQIRKI